MNTLMKSLLSTLMITVISFGSTTSLAQDGPRLLGPEIELEDLTTVPKKDLEFLIQFGQHCNQAVLGCSESLKDHQKALAEQEAVIDEQAKLIGELDSKRGPSWFSAGTVGIVLGVVLSGVLLKK